jgi:hypothetical protein
MLRVSDYASKGGVRLSGRFSFYHKSDRVSHFVSYHKRGHVSFYHESGARLPFRI